MYEEEKAFQICKNDSIINVSLRDHQIQIRCFYNLRIKKGSYTFDALPQLLKVFQNIEEIFNHLKQIKNTEDFKVVEEGIQVAFSISLKIKKKVIIALENGVITNQEKLSFQIDRLKNQLKRVQQQKIIEIQKTQILLREEIKKNQETQIVACLLEKQLNQYKKEHLRKCQIQLVFYHQTKQFFPKIIDKKAEILKIKEFISMTYKVQEWKRQNSQKNFFDKIANVFGHNKDELLYMIPLRDIKELKENIKKHLQNKLSQIIIYDQNMTRF